MNPGGESAEQMVRMTLQGIEVMGELAIKGGAEFTKSFAVMMYAILSDQKKVKGKTRLTNLLKNEQGLDVIAIKSQDLKLFCKEAKKYGILYTVLKEKNNKDGICDIMVRTQDAAKIGRICDRFKLATINTKEIRDTIENGKDVKLQDVKPLSDQEHDDLINQLMNSTKKTMQKEKESEIVPPKSLTDIKKSEDRSESSCVVVKKGFSKKERPSVRKKLETFKEKNEFISDDRTMQKRFYNRRKRKDHKRER